MADWFYPTLPSTGKPVTAEWGAAVQENPVAITEGAPGAPRIAFAAMGPWLTTYGGVGTYVLARAGTTSTSAGATVAGSTLEPVGGATSITVGTGSAGTVTAGTGSNLSGTWRSMGTSSAMANGGITAQFLAVLFVRIA